MAFSSTKQSSDVAKDVLLLKQAHRQEGHTAFAVEDVKDRAGTNATGVVAEARRSNFGKGNAKLGYADSLQK
jgi:hypothetical protein